MGTIVGLDTESSRPTWAHTRDDDDESPRPGEGPTNAFLGDPRARPTDKALGHLVADALNTDGPRCVVQTKRGGRRPSAGESRLHNG